jgi:hypothetical protein
MELLRETISGRANDLKMGQKEVKSHMKISLLCDLNSIYSVMNLKLWNIKENYNVFDIPTLQKKNQVSQFLVQATASL